MKLTVIDSPTLVESIAFFSQGSGLRGIILIRHSRIQLEGRKPMKPGSLRFVLYEFMSISLWEASPLPTTWQPLRHAESQSSPRLREFT